MRSWGARLWVILLVVGCGLTASEVRAQPAPGGGGFGPPGFPPPPSGEKRKILKAHDKNADGWLNTEERLAAREALKSNPGGQRFGPGGPGGPFGGPMGRRGQTPTPGVRIKPSEVPSYPEKSLYDTEVLRTLFFDFPSDDWEAELEEFHGTDVEVPATLVVDGKSYSNVGVHFRGMSSYMGVGRGSKRSLNVSIDLSDKKQRLLGYKTLNLLNAHDDSSMMSTVLYSHIAKQYLPAPRANFVRVVINGENWGIYTNVQQFNKEFLRENYKTEEGARWKVSGSPQGRGGLRYVGERIEDYRSRYEIKSADKDESWRKLIAFCKLLDETPADQLETALAAVVDVDELLSFLAIDIALINNDGYWVRSSDYNIYLDPQGKFHFIPHDMNEAFKPMMGPGGPGGPGGGFFPRPGEVLPQSVQRGLQLSDDQRAALDALQKDVDAKLAQILNREQNRQLAEMRERAPGGFGPPGMGFGLPGLGLGGNPARGDAPAADRPAGGRPVAGGRGVDLDPLTGLQDAEKPLRSKVLANPKLRDRYLDKVKMIASKSLDWKELGPVAARLRKLIEEEVRRDTKKLDSFEAFERFTSDAPAVATPSRAAGPTSTDPARPGAEAGRGLFPGGRDMSIRHFADERRTFLLKTRTPALPSPAKPASR